MDVCGEELIWTKLKRDFFGRIIWTSACSFCEYKFFAVLFILSVNMLFKQPVSWLCSLVLQHPDVYRSFSTDNWKLTICSCWEEWWRSVRMSLERKVKLLSGLGGIPKMLVQPRHILMLSMNIWWFESGNGLISPGEKKKEAMTSRVDYTGAFWNMQGLLGLHYE